jgi:hypothetical protein
VKLTGTGQNNDARGGDTSNPIPLAGTNGHRSGTNRLPPTASVHFQHIQKIRQVFAGHSWSLTQTKRDARCIAWVIHRLQLVENEAFQFMQEHKS